MMASGTKARQTKGSSSEDTVAILDTLIGRGVSVDTAVAAAKQILAAKKADGNGAYDWRRTYDIEDWIKRRRNP